MNKFKLLSFIFILASWPLDLVQAKNSDPWEGVHCSSKTPVAVDRFKSENLEVGWWNEDIALNSREVAVDELLQSGCFTVLEREEGTGAPAGVMNEKGLARSDEAAPGSPIAAKGQMKIASKLISFALTGFSKNSEGVNLGGYGGGIGGFGGIGGGVKKSQLNLACKVIDAATSEILSSARVEAGGTGFSIGGGGGGYGSGGYGGGGIGYFKDSKVGKMMSQAIHKCVVKMARQMGG